MDRFRLASQTTRDLYRTLRAVFEVAKQPIVDFYADVVLVFFQTKTTEEEVLHPMIADFSYDCFLNLITSTMSSF
jgi:hypothetical protein